MPTEDFSGFEARYERQLDNLAEADIAEADREAIQLWLQRRDGDLAVSSLAQYCSRLVTLAEYSDIPLVDLELTDAEHLFFEYRHDEEAGRGGKPSDQTVYNMQATLATFANDRDDDWVDDFEANKPDDKSKAVDENDMLTQEDIAALVDAADRPRNQAIIEFLADTGARLTLMGSLRVCDVDLDGERATYTPNPNAIGLKGVEIKPYPLIDSKATLRVYLRHSHPRPDDPEAALFHKFRQYEDTDGSLSPSRIWRLTTDLGKEAGVDKPTNPHNFRHSAVTRMWREGYDKSEIQHRVHWRLDTDMWEYYVHVTAEQMNEQIFAEAGVVEDDNSLSAERERCGNCREVVAPHAEYCMNCGEPLTKDARDEHLDRVQDHTDAQVKLGDMSRRELRAEIIRMLNENPRRGHD